MVSNLSNIQVIIFDIYYFSDFYLLACIVLLRSIFIYKIYVLWLFLLDF